MKKTIYFTILLTLMLSLNTFGAEKKLKAAGCKTEAILMDELCSNYPAARIKPSRTGNKKGLILFAEGKTDFAFTCKPAGSLIKKFKLNTAKTKDWKCIAFAKDPLIIIANPDTGITELSLIDLSKIFTGKASNWSEFGGNNLPITIGYMDTQKVETGNNTVFKECVLQKYVSPSGAITGTPNPTPNLKADFSKQATILDSPDKLGNFVRATPGAITFMGLNSYQDKCGTALKINGISPNIDTVRSGEYPMAVTYHLIYNPKGSTAVTDFVDFVTSEQGRKITAKNFVDIDAVEAR